MKRDTSASRASLSPYLCQRANSSSSPTAGGATGDLGTAVAAEATVLLRPYWRTARLFYPKTARRTRHFRRRGPVRQGNRPLPRVNRSAFARGAVLDNRRARPPQSRRWGGSPTGRRAPGGGTA